MGDYTLSFSAVQDVVHILDAIKEQSGPVRAKSFAIRIGEALASLASAPRVGREMTDLYGAPRCFAISPWSVLYSPSAEGRGMHVLRIVDGRRDLSDNL